MPIAPDGPQAAEFLSTVFTEDTSQRPEFTLGPASLRRVELQKLASLINEEFRPGLGALQMVPTVVEWMVAGRFDHLVKEGARAGGTVVDLEREKAHTAELSALNLKIAAMESMFRDFVSAGDSQQAMERMRQFIDGGEAADVEIAADPILSNPDAAATMDPMDWADIEAMAYKDLRAYAREIGVTSGGKSHDALLADVRAKLLIDPIDLQGDDAEEGQTEDDTDVENAA